MAPDSPFLRLLTSPGNGGASVTLCSALGGQRTVIGSREERWQTSASQAQLLRRWLDDAKPAGGFPRAFYVAQLQVPVISVCQ